MKRLMTMLLSGLAAVAGAETVDLVSAKGVNATAWVELASPGDGELTAKVTVPNGFETKLLRVVKEPRDPNAYFTGVPGFGEKVPVGVGLADAAKGAPAKTGERVLFRVVIPVGEKATEGVHTGKIALSCGGKSAGLELCLKVLDFVLPPAKSRYSGRAWTAKYEGGVPSDWTVETADTYAKDSTEVTSVAGSLKTVRDDLPAERWRAFGVPYYGLVDLPRVLNPDIWRGAAGIGAWQLGFDGAAVPAGEPLEDVLKAALEDALIDVRYVSYASELSNELAKKDRHASKVVYEGRLGQFWCDRIRVQDDNLDVVRLETQARLVRLLAFTRKEASK